MAEINIERKKKPIWPWLLLILLVGLLIWAIYELTSDKDDVETDDVAVSSMVIPAKEQPALVYRTAA